MAEQINQDITIPSDPPSSRDRVNFRLRADAFVAWMKTFATQINSLIPQLNTALEWINTNVQNAVTYSQTATDQAGTATIKASEASASATAAYNAKIGAEAALDAFDDKYLGAKSDFPIVDNDGDPLQMGATFFKSSSPKGHYVYDSELQAWQPYSFVPTAHSSLSGRNDTDAHTISSISGLENTLLQKANKSTTLEGYGINNAYTRTEVDNSIDALKDVAQNAQSTAYTLALTDRGKSIDVSTGGITITVPLSSAVAFPIGTTVTITNLAATAITIGAGATLRQAGTTNTGNRTLAAYGMATLRKVGTDTWFISGAGLS